MKKTDMCTSLFVVLTSDERFYVDKLKYLKNRRRESCSYKCLLFLCRFEKSLKDNTHKTMHKEKSELFQRLFNNPIKCELKKHAEIRLGLSFIKSGKKIDLKKRMSFASILPQKPVFDFGICSQWCP